MSIKSSRHKTRVLAVASGGGHWVQLLRLRPAFDGCETAYVTVHRSYRQQADGCRFYTLSDSNRTTPLKLLKTAAQIAFILLRERPDVVISTGAAPGYLALRLGRLLGARTIWLESIANAEHLSLSGTKVGPYADLWLTQWPALATPGGPRFAGSVL